jgi:hypothetical protein
VSSLLLVPKRKAVKSIALNAFKIIRLFRRQRGCHYHLAESGVDGAAKIAMEAYALMAPHLGDIRGQTGLEVGPGDNLGVADCFLANGARRMICVEQFPTVQRSEPMRDIIYQRFGTRKQGSPELIVGEFETTSEGLISFTRLTCLSMLLMLMRR